MISFRFHVVSITAVFLAIAIGVVVGTTYVDGAVVDGLRNRINTVEENLDERRAENDRLEQELERNDAYIEASASFAVTGRLTDAPVLLLAPRGIDEAAVQRTVTLVRQAGGATPGVVWMEPRWALEGEDERAALATIIGGDPDDEPDALRSDAWSAVAAELAAPPDSPPDPTTPDTDPAESVLVSLAEAGFLSVDAVGEDSTGLGDLADTAPRVLVVTGTRAEAGPDALVPLVAQSMVGADLLTVLADVHVDAPEAPPRGEELLAGLSESLIEVVSVVDHADQLEGQVASVLALSAAPGETAVHLGYGNGAVGVLPEWTPP